MASESESESSATMKAVAWIEEFMASLGGLRPEVHASLLGLRVLAIIDANDVTFSYMYDPQTSAPALAAEHFKRNVALLRRKPRMSGGSTI